MISKYVNFSGLKSNFLACFAQNIQCICTCYIKLLFNRLIQNMLSVPDVENGLARFLHTPYLSILIHHHIIWACKKYTKKCLHSRKYSRTWSQWDKIGQNFAFIILKSTPAQKKVHHRWLWRL